MKGIKTVLGPSVCELLPSVNAIVACEEAIVYLYGSHAGEGFDKLHYCRFFEKLAANTSSVQVHTSPQTVAAARYHSTCVYTSAHLTPNCSSC